MSFLPLEHHMWCSGIQWKKTHRHFKNIPEVPAQSEDFCTCCTIKENDNMNNLHLKFRINDELITIEEPIDGSLGSEHLFKITNDDDYTVQYIIDLINNGLISLKEPLQYIFRVDDEIEMQIYSLPSMREDDQNENVLLNEQEEHETTSWDDRATKLLLSLYEEFRPKVGKTVKFKTQAKMWTVICDLMTEKGYKFSPIQINNRFKTLERSYKKMVDISNKTGQGRKQIPYERQLEDILGKKANILPPMVIGKEGLQVLKKSENIQTQNIEIEKNINNENIQPQNDTPLDENENYIQKEQESTPKKCEKTKIRKKDGKTALILKDVKASMATNLEHIKKLVEERSKTNEHLREANNLRKERNELLRELLSNKKLTE